MSLYTEKYRPFRLPPQYEATSIALTGAGQAGDILRAKGASETLGDPIDGIAFFDDDSGQLMALTCDYANGRRVEYRRTRRGSRLNFTTSARAEPLS